MPTPCQVCSHPEIESINQAIQQGTESTRLIAKKYGLSQSTVARHKINHVEPAIIDNMAQEAKQIDAVVKVEVPPSSGYQPLPGQIDAYRDMLFLRDKAVELMARLENRTDPEGEPMQVPTMEMAIAMRELRETTKTMVMVYEAQRRIESEYSPPETIQTTITYRFLRDKYPAVLKELVAHIKEAR